MCYLGHIGERCDKICDHYNPCGEGTVECVTPTSSPGGYVCRCDEHHTGRYCEQSINQTCPSSWWGSPICGPCNCPKDRGFDPSCDKQTGQCSCRVCANKSRSNMHYAANLKFGLKAAASVSLVLQFYVFVCVHRLSLWSDSCRCFFLRSSLVDPKDTIRSMGDLPELSQCFKSPSDCSLG